MTMQNDTHDTDEILERLSRIEILRALPPQEILALITHVQRLTIPAGTCFIREGEKGDALYLIEEGTTCVERSVDHGQAPKKVGEGSVVGEGALLTGETRNASVTAETNLVLWKIGKSDFDEVVAASPELIHALEVLRESRRTGGAMKLRHPAAWLGHALRAVEARYRGMTMWQILFAIGMALWAFLAWKSHAGQETEADGAMMIAIVELVAGMLIIQGACEAFLHGCDRLGARLGWDGFLAGTVGSLLSTAPEFVVIAFLVQVDPVAAVVTSVVTIYNNGLAFSIYSFFLPKDRHGAYTMPRSLTSAGGEILIAGGSIALIVGVVMFSFRLHDLRPNLMGWDLLAVGAVLLVIYAYYVVTLVKFYAEGKDDEDSHPPDPESLGHDTSIGGIVSMFAMGIVGAYCGGEAIGAFAESALQRLGLPTIPTAAALAFFAGISEYIIVYKSHRRGELGIALSNVFGGMTQVMFLLLPFAFIVIGGYGLATGDPRYVLPINAATTLLMFLLFPLFYALFQHLQEGKSLSNLDAASMTGIYMLLLYFLFTAPS